MNNSVYTYVNDLIDLVEDNDDDDEYTQSVSDVRTALNNYRSRLSTFNGTFEDEYEEREVSQLCDDTERNVRGLAAVSNQMPAGCIVNNWSLLTDTVCDDTIVNTAIFGDGASEDKCCKNNKIISLKSLYDSAYYGCSNSVYKNVVTSSKHNVTWRKQN